MNFTYSGFDPMSDGDCWVSNHELPTYPSPLADMPTFLRENEIDVFLNDDEDFPTIKMTTLKYIRRPFHALICRGSGTIIGMFEPTGLPGQCVLARYRICDKCGKVEQLW